MAWNDFVPQMQGRDLKVTTIDSAHGPFQIAFVCMYRDGDGTSYFYQDERARFGFVVDKHLLGEIRIDVKLASAGGPSSGVAFKTSQDNEVIFRSNIEFFFTTRIWMMPWRPLTPNSAKIIVDFSWRIVQ